MAIGDHGSKTADAARRYRLWRILAGLAVLAAGLAAAPFVISECDVCEAATILLTGVVPGKCTVVVTPSAGASNLPISTAGAQRVAVGSIVQNCTGNRSYTVTVTSQNCLAAPSGAKLVGADSGDYLGYSAEFTNPTTGGSQADVTGLMASSCANQVGRAVTSGHISNETSTVYVNFAGVTTLGAGSYNDVIVVSLNMQ